MIYLNRTEVHKVTSSDPLKVVGGGETAQGNGEVTKHISNPSSLQSSVILHNEAKIQLLLAFRAQRARSALGNASLPNPHLKESALTDQRDSRDHKALQCP